MLSISSRPQCVNVDEALVDISKCNATIKENLIHMLQMNQIYYQYSSIFLHR